MTDYDIDNHPSHKAFCAGVQFAKENLGYVASETVRATSREWEDREAFMDGFYSERNDE